MKDSPRKSLTKRAGRRNLSRMLAAPVDSTQTELIQMESDEMWRELESEAKRRLGLSVDDMLSLDKVGKLRNRADVRDLLMIARLLTSSVSEAA